MSKAISFEGVTYKSFSALCRAKGFKKPNDIVKAHLRFNKLGWPLEQVFQKTPTARSKAVTKGKRAAAKAAAELAAKRSAAAAKAAATRKAKAEAALAA